MVGLCLSGIFKFEGHLRKLTEVVFPLYKEAFIDILQNQIFIHFTGIFSTKELVNYTNKVHSINNQITFSRQITCKVHSKYRSYFKFIHFKEKIK